MDSIDQTEPDYQPGLALTTKRSDRSSKSTEGGRTKITGEINEPPGGARRLKKYE